MSVGGDVDSLKKKNTKRRRPTLSYTRSHTNLFNGKFITVIILFHALLLLSVLSQISAFLDRECRFIRSTHIPLSIPSNKRRNGGEIDV